MMTIKKFNIHEEGLNRFFGPLEAKIMDIIWSSEGLGIKEVQERLSRENPISFNTVMTVMNRLLEKGHLKKSFVKGQGRSRITCYEAVQTLEQFLAEQTKMVTYGLIHEYGDLVVNHMIDALNETDPDLMDRLKNKLNEMKSRERS